MADGSIVINTKVDDSGLKKDLKGLSKGLKKGLAVAAKGAAIGLAAVAAGFIAISKAAKKFSEVTDRVDKLSQKIGISREAFQEWDFILSQSGASVEGLQMSMKTLTRAADEANQGVATYSDSFDRLGISVTDANGNIKDSEILFNETFTALSNLESETERTALASELLGRSATELAPAFNAGSEAIEDMRQQAHDLGLVMSDDVIDMGVVLTDNMDQLRRTGRGLFTELFANIVPALNKATNALTDWISGEGGVQQILMNIGNFFIDVGVAMKKAWFSTVVALQNAWGNTVSFLKQAGQSYKASFITVVNSIKIAMLALSGFIYDKVLGSVEKLLSVMGKLPFVGKMFDKAAEAVGGFNDNIQASIQEAKDAAAANIAAVWEERRAIAEANRQEIADRMAALEQKKALIDEETEARKQQRAEDAAAEQERLTAEAKANIDLKNKMKLQQDLMTIEGDYQTALRSNQKKFEAGLITQEDLTNDNIRAMENYINALFEMGVTTETAAGKGGKMLRDMIAGLKSTKGEAKTAGEETGNSVSEGMRNELESGFVKAITIIKKGLQNIAGFVKNGIEFIGKAAKWMAAFNPAALIESLRELADGITEFFLTDIGSLPIFFDQGMQIIQDMIDGIMGNLPNIVLSIKNVIKHMANSLVDNAPQMISAMVEILLSIVEAIIDNIDLILDAGLSILMGLVNAVIDNIDKIVDMAVTLLVKLTVFISENIDIILEAAILIVTGLALGILDNIDIIILAVIGMLPEIVKAFVSIIPLLVKVAPQIIGALVGALVTAIWTTLEALVSAWAGLFDDMFTAIEEYFEENTLGDLGEDIIQGLIDGIKAMFTPVINAFTDIWDAIVNGFKDFFGIASPSKVFSDLGNQLIQGLINGISGMAGAVWDAITGLFSGIFDWTKNLFNGIGDGIASAVDATVSGISGAVDATGKALGGAWDATTGAVGGAIDATGNAINDAAKATGNAINDAGNAVKKLFSFDSGSPNLPRDMLAQVHQGERIVPKTFNQDLMQGNTVMLAPEALGQMMNSNIGTRQSTMINVNIPLTLDGREIARASYRHLDEMAAGA